MKTYLSKVAAIGTMLLLGTSLLAFLWIDPVGLFTLKTSGFTRDQWNAINAGLTQAEVYARLGEPFKRIEIKEKLGMQLTQPTTTCSMPVHERLSDQHGRIGSPVCDAGRLSGLFGEAAVAIRICLPSVRDSERMEDG